MDSEDSVLYRMGYPSYKRENGVLVNLLEIKRLRDFDIYF